MTVFMRGFGQILLGRKIESEIARQGDEGARLRYSAMNARSPRPSTQIRSASGKRMWRK